MHFLVDDKNKVLFGWSAKCGCSHIKHIYFYLTTGSVIKNIHTDNAKNKLPDNIQDYTTVIIARNPYERIISGFLNKYRTGGEYRDLYKTSFLSFSQFVDEVINSNWKKIEKHHFTPQTSEAFNEKMLHSKDIKFYDIKNIDYEYIEQLYNKKLPQYIIDFKGDHTRNQSIKIKTNYDKYVYDLNIDDYIDCIVDTKYFYNQQIKEKIFNFYINDFKFFYKNGIDYIKSDYL